MLENSALFLLGDNLADKIGTYPQFRGVIPIVIHISPLHSNLILLSPFGQFLGWSVRQTKKPRLTGAFWLRKLTQFTGYALYLLCNPVAIVDKLEIRPNDLQGSIQSRGGNKRYAALVNRPPATAPYAAVSKPHAPFISSPIVEKLC